MANEKDNVHAGHRARMRERFFANPDFDGFEEHEILEFIIGYIQPRKNMNVVAHRLMDKFGSLGRVFDAPSDELMNVEGVGPQMAAFIKAQCALLRVYMKEKYSILSSQNSEDNLYRHIDALFIGYTTERMYMVSLDNANRVLKTTLLFEGTCDRVAVDLNTIMREAILAKASGVILAHNHPSGTPIASQEDIDVTRYIEDGLNMIHVRLIDHIIVAGGKHVCISDDPQYAMRRFAKTKKK